MAKKTRTRNFGDVIRAKLAADTQLAADVEEESFNADIAQQVYDIRSEAELTQKQLAAMVGTQQSVISRIEDADYDGHSLALLKKIANVLHKRLRVDLRQTTSIARRSQRIFARLGEAASLVSGLGR